LAWRIGIGFVKREVPRVCSFKLPQFALRLGALNALSGRNRRGTIIPCDGFLVMKMLKKQWMESERGNSVWSRFFVLHAIGHVLQIQKEKELY